MLLVLLLTTVLPGDLPPLSGEQQVRLETAVDGRDHQEEAFVALMENVRGWNGSVGDQPIRLQPDLDAISSDPASNRGSLCRLHGVIQQRTRLARPHHHVSEWFIRDDEGRPIVVYVVDSLPAGAAEKRQPGVFRDGQRVTLIGRFYKTVQFTARDGQQRSYPAFVTSAGATRPLEARARLSPALVAVPVGVMLVAFIVLLLYTRRLRAARSSAHRRVLDPPGYEEDGDLPDDPAEALAELKRRAEST